MELTLPPTGQSARLSFEKLTEARLDTAAALCDRCVGERLYPRSYLASVVDNPAHSFYLLTTREREIMGYVYFTLADLDEMASLSKLPRAQLAAVSPKAAPVIGNLRSIGVVEAYRRRRLSGELVGFFLNWLQTHSAADAALGVCWKPNGRVPMEGVLKAFGFLYLADARRVWYDNDDLVCPYCKGRCKCGAAIYYKSLESVLKPAKRPNGGDFSV